MVSIQEWDRRIALAADVWRSETKIASLPPTLVVLGSGFKAFASSLKLRSAVDMSQLPFFPRPGVKGHGAQILVGKVGNSEVGVFTGRAHLYEGFTAQEVVFPLRVAQRLGVRHVILTNATGGVNPALKPGTVALIADQINLTGTHCLTGEGGFFGPQFLDMVQCYHPAWREAMRTKFKLPECVYGGLTGPTYETKAECRMLRTLGMDVVGMSTVQEAIAAHHLGVKVGGLTFVTNACAGTGEGGSELTHDEVVAMGKKSAAKLVEILEYGVGVWGDKGASRAAPVTARSTKGVKAKSKLSAMRPSKAKKRK